MLNEQKDQFTIMNCMDILFLGGKTILYLGCSVYTTYVACGYYGIHFSNLAELNTKIVHFVVC